MQVQIHFVSKANLVVELDQLFEQSEKHFCFARPSSHACIVDRTEDGMNVSLFPTAWHIIISYITRQQ